MILDLQPAFIWHFTLIASEGACIKVPQGASRRPGSLRLLY